MADIKKPTFDTGFDAELERRCDVLARYIDLMNAAAENEQMHNNMYLTTKDVAAYLHCSEPTAREYMHREGFPLLTVGENKFMVFAPAFHMYNMEARNNPKKGGYR